MEGRPIGRRLAWAIPGVALGASNLVAGISMLQNLCGDSPALPATFVGIGVVSIAMSVINWAWGDSPRPSKHIELADGSASSIADEASRDQWETQPLVVPTERGAARLATGGGLGSRLVTQGAWTGSSGL